QWLPVVSLVGGGSTVVEQRGWVQVSCAVHSARHDTLPARATPSLLLGGNRQGGNANAKADLSLRIVETPSSAPLDVPELQINVLEGRNLRLNLSEEHYQQYEEAPSFRINPVVEVEVPGVPKDRTAAQFGTGNPVWSRSLSFPFLVSPWTSTATIRLLHDRSSETGLFSGAFGDIGGAGGSVINLMAGTR
ncbi:unnamed protein product, partial [Amoebophrya sp. A25]